MHLTDLKWIFACDFLNSRFIWWVETAYLGLWFGNSQLKLCVSGRSEAKETWLAQLSVMKWVVFSCFQQSEREGKRNYFHSRECRIQNILFSHHKNVHAHAMLSISIYWKELLAGVLSRIISVSCYVRLCECCLHGSCCAVPLLMSHMAAQ